MAMRPDVPYSPVPSVMPETQAPNDYIRADASPQDFGSQVGGALQQVGQAGATVDNDASNIAIQRQDRFNQIATDASVTQLQQQFLNKTYGVPGDPSQPGLFSLRGADALHAAPQAMQSLEATRQQIRGGLQNDVQRLAFDEQSRRVVQYTETEIARHLDQQQDAYGLATNRAMVATSASSAGLRWNDDANLSNALQGARTGMVRSYQIQYGHDLTPELTQEAVQKADDQVISAAIIAALPTDPGRAGAILQAHGDELSPHIRAELTDHVQGKLYSTTGKAIANGVWNNTPGASADGLVQREARDQGVDVTLARTIASLESSSGTAPDAPGNVHTGVFQLGPAEFQAGGGGAGQRGNVPDEVRAGVGWLRQIEPQADAAVGGSAEPWQIYLMHQQGVAGGAALLKADAATPILDVLTPVYAGDRQAAARAITSNAGDPNGTVGQFRDLWQTRYGAAERGIEGRTGGPVYPDISRGVQTILERTEGQPEQVRNAALAEFERQVNLYKLQTETQRSAISKQVNDAKDALEAGKDDIAIPATAIRATFPPAQAEDMVEQLNVARTAGQVFRGIQFASPDDIAASRADLASGLGVRSRQLRAGAGSVTPDDLASETPDQFGLRQRVLARFDALVAARQTALKTDPAGYVAAAPTVAAALTAYQQASPDQQTAAFGAYVSATQAAQKRLGVADQDVRVLATAQSQGIARQIMTGDPSKVDTGGQLDAMAKQYGDGWPSVWHDLVRDGHMPPEWQVLATLPPGADRMQMQRALQSVEVKGGLEKLRQDVNPDQAQLIDRGVDASLDDFRKSVMIPGLTSNTDLFTGVRNAVRTTALFSALSGQDGQVALDRTAGALPYDYIPQDRGVFNARAPKGQGGAVESYAATVLQGLTPSALGVVRTGNPDLTMDQAQNAYVAAVRRAGVWVTNERDDGWTLALPDRSGGYQLVTRPDGSRVGFKFAAVPTGQGSAAPVEAPVAPMFSGGS